MKQLLIITVVFLSLLSSVSLAKENFYVVANAERLQAVKEFARARVLVAGTRIGKSINEKTYMMAIDKAKVYVDSADDHLSKAREYLMKGYHNGDIDESSVNEFKQRLKKQRNNIARLRSSIDGMHLRFTKKYNIVVEGPDRAVAVADFLGWFDYVKLLRETEMVKWTGSAVTKHLWEKAGSYSGFYAIHINNLADSVNYVDDREKISQEDYDYVRDGMKRFTEFHNQFIKLLGKIKAAHNAGFEDRQKWAEVSIRPYLSQKVFSGLPTRKAIPELPGDPAENLGYIPTQSMMQAFSDLPNKPSLMWIKRDKNVMKVLRALYDRGFALEFLKKFVNLGGKFKVEVTNESGDGRVVYYPLDGTLNIPKGKYNYDRLNIDRSLLADLLRELFHAYCSQIIDADNDPLTKNLLVNTEIWLGRQFIRQESNKGSKVWWEFSAKIDDAKGFTKNYVGEMIHVSFSNHISIWNNLHQKSRDSRITVEKATAIWEQKKSTVISTKYLASESDDSMNWEVQSIPPVFNFNYINAFYGFGEY